MLHVNKNQSWKSLLSFSSRAVASLTVPGGQEFHFPHFFLKFQSIFPQTLLIFFLILALRVGDSPTREGPGYATVFKYWSLIGNVCESDTSAGRLKVPFAVMCHIFGLYIWKESTGEQNKGREVR